MIVPIGELEEYLATFQADKSGKELNARRGVKKLLKRHDDHPKRQMFRTALELFSRLN